MATTSQSQGESQWVDALVREAGRDLVFLWHISGGRLGGPKYTSAELPAAIERISRSMLERGCIVGFGDPDSDSWEVPSALAVPIEEQARRVAELWASDPKQFEFLVFALRPKTLSRGVPSA